MILSIVFLLILFVVLQNNGQLLNVIAFKKKSVHTSES